VKLFGRGKKKAQSASKAPKRRMRIGKKAGAAPPPSEDFDDLEELASADDLDLDSIDDLDSDDELEPLDELASGDQLEALDELSSADELEPLAELGSAAELDELASADELEPLEELASADDLDDLEELEELASDDELEALEPLDELASDDELEELDELASADELDELEPLEELPVVADPPTREFPAPHVTRREARMRKAKKTSPGPQRAPSASALKAQALARAGPRGARGRGLHASRGGSRRPH
jgi:hypothetical protein